MKFFASFFTSVLFVVAQATSIATRAPGPSGVLVTPNDATRVRDIDGVKVVYTRVNGAQGFYTEYIDIDLVDYSTADGGPVITHRVAEGLTSQNKQTNIEAWFNIPRFNAPHLSEGGFQIVITEHQIGLNGPIQFRAAAPTFHVTVVPQPCPGKPLGNCGNTA
ncbi:hypothetical protein BT69DRAFT_1351792 [Atractiella rhizophila]|nr:hypothetical protein BT69DRAFT_1351792 [Atractiella rhizophila]